MGGYHNKSSDSRVFYGGNESSFILCVKTKKDIDFTGKDLTLKALQGFPWLKWFLLCKEVFPALSIH